jgi:hypothetical protein
MNYCPTIPIYRMT